MFIGIVALARSRERLARRSQQYASDISKLEQENKLVILDRDNKILQLKHRTERVTELEARAKEAGQNHQELTELYEERLEVWKVEAEKTIRQQTLERARAVSHGFSGENFAPLLSDLPHKDFRHLGDPIDYLVIAGADAVRKKESDEVEMVYLLEIKTGKSNLNRLQRRIRDAVVAGRCCFAVYNTDTREFQSWARQED